MEIVVTGGAGFLGSHLVEALVDHNVTVYDNLSRGQFSSRNLMEIKDKCKVVVGDILDLDKVKSVINGAEVIFHMAALPSHRLALEAPHSYINVDVMGTANVLEAAWKSESPPLVIFASSNKVYGHQSCLWKEDKPPKPEGPYAISKYSSELLCQMYDKYFGVPCVILRYHHVAGRRSNPELALSLFVEAALNKKPINIHGKWDKGVFTSCSADYTHVDDATNAAILAMEDYSSFEIYNIANERLIAVEELAMLVMARLGEVKINRINMLSHETLVHHSDVSKMKKSLGFSADTPVKKAVNDYIDWRLKWN